ncbi:glycosyltransferase family protein [Mucilaginibacter sp.]
MALKILIISQSHLCRNPRVLKEAIALDNAGFKVYILNTISSRELQRQDLDLVKDHPNIRLQHAVDLTQKGFASFFDRAIYKLGCMLLLYLKLENALALGYGALKYAKKCRAINAGLYICHQELATYIGCKLMKAGYNVAFDFEDWYSADLLPEARKTRPINLLKNIEAKALKEALFCTTTSHALSLKLAQIYSCDQPEVIYNTFPRRANLLSKKKTFVAPLKLFWFSQTIGPGRGIEEFIGLSGAFSTGHELHLLGNVDASYRGHLLAMMPAQHHLIFHPLVRERDLAGRIRDFDIGLALELAEPPSRNYTVTNKFFQYIEAGLPVIATATAGQKEVFEKFNAGFMLPQAPGPADIQNLDDWLNDAAALRMAQFIAQKASLFYSWESQAQTLLNLIQKAIE